MPELPEVENVRRKLLDLVLNKEITNVAIFYEKMIRTPEPEIFKSRVIGQTITNITRRGKHLIFILDEKYALISHLRMEGKYFYFEEKSDKSKHDHMILFFSDGSELHYHDVRKFGTMDLILLSQLDSFKSIKDLGPEPHETQISDEYLYQKFQRKSSPIKNLLLDQTIISGLGNIYVDEILFQANIHPIKKGNSLSKNDCYRLSLASKKIISLAIEKGGSTIRSYNSLGTLGEMQVLHQVYGKNGQACHSCSETIQKIKISGRGTHFCPKCQPEN